MMNVGRWVTDREDMFVAISSFISAVGFVLVAYSLLVAMEANRLSAQALGKHEETLEHQKNISKARTYFEVQKLAMDSNRKVFEEGNLKDYLENGKKGMRPDELAAARDNFSSVVHVFYIVFRQFEFETLLEEDWKRAYKELCTRLIRTNGGNDYFYVHPLEETLFKSEYLEKISECREGRT